MFRLIKMDIMLPEQISNKRLRLKYWKQDIAWRDLLSIDERFYILKRKRFYLINIRIVIKIIYTKRTKMCTQTYHGQTQQ